MSPSRPATVVVSHANALVEAGLRHILGKLPGLDVEPISRSDRSLSTLAKEADLFVLDHDSCIQWAKDNCSGSGMQAKVMVVAMSGQDIHARAAIEAGVRGYVLIDCAPEEIADAAVAVAAGRRHLCSVATLRMADSLAQPTLTQREHDVIALVFRGSNNKEVARSLNISVGTVKSHMRGVMSKLGARCRTEASWIASQRGLIGLQEDPGAIRTGASVGVHGGRDTRTRHMPRPSSKAPGKLQLIESLAA